MRRATRADRVMEDYLEQYAGLNPIVATELGMPGHDAELPDLSPDGLAEVSALRRRTLSALRTVAEADDIDRVTVSAAIDGYIASLRLACRRGDPIARRQVEAGIAQSRDNESAQGPFATLAKGPRGDGFGLSAAARTRLERSARAAADAYGALRSFLRDELYARATATDAVGRERYAIFSRWSLGAEIDIDECYAWVQAELARVREQMAEVAGQVEPGLSVVDAMSYLTADPARRVRGADALRAWMQWTSDEAIAALDAHFDIPEPMRRLECLIAPTAGGGIYYTGPSEDFSRPGRVWWGIPEGVDEFSTWQQLATVYHEGVPGHHLQVGHTAYRRDLLNRWRRMAAWVDGHGEGWALYAERLMADLGFFDDPGDHLGLLDSQSFRAVRVVIDLGVHCGLTAPGEVGGGAWTYEKAWQMLRRYSAKHESRLRFELDRYFGLPAQASSYKLGERRWLQLRESVRSREGDAFDLKSFHRRALDVGSVGLDVLESAVLGDSAREPHAAAGAVTRTSP